jgi:hypothetical protein
MADQKERIILEVDEKGAVTATASANKEVAKLEAAFYRAGQTAEQRLLAKIETLKGRMANDPMRLKELDALQQKTFSRMRENIDKAGDDLSGFGQKVRNFVQNPLQSAGEIAGSAATKLGAMGAAATIAFGLLAAGATTGYAAAKSLGAYGDQLGDTSVRLGLTAKQTYQLDFAMKYAGGSIGTLETAMRMLSRGLAEGSTEGKIARDTLAAMGVRGRDAAGNLRPITDILENLSQKFKATTDLAQRNAWAMDVFGRAGMELLPDLLELSSGIERASKLKWGPDDKDLERWQKYQQQIVEVESAWESLKRKMLEPLAGTVTVTLRWLSSGEMAKPGMAPGGRMGAAGIRSWTEDALRESGLFIDLTENRQSLLSSATSSLAWEARDTTARRAGGAAELERLRAAFGASKEGIEAALAAARKDFTEAREKLFSSEGLRDFEVTTRQQALDAKAAEVARLEARLKAIVDAEKLKSAIPELEGRVAAFMVGGGPRKYSPIEMEGLEYALGQSAVQAGMLNRWLPDKSIDAQMRKAEELSAYMEVMADDLQRASERQISSLEREMRLQEQLIELQAGPGGEMAAIEQTYQMRLDYAQRIYDIEKLNIGDVLAGYKLQAEQEEASVRRIEEIARLQQRRFDDLRQSMEGLFDAAFTRSRGILDTLKGMGEAVFLTPVKQGLSAMMSRALMPVMYGQDGSGGIMGRIFGAFGGGMDQVKLIDGAVPVRVMGAGTAGAAAGLAGIGGMPSGGGVFGPGSIVGGPGGTASGGWKAALAGAMPALAAMGGTMLASGSYGLTGAGHSPLLRALGVAGTFAGSTLAGGAIGTMIMPGLGTIIGLGVGAGVGLFAGLFGLFRSSPAQKVIEKVKALYGVTIDKPLAQRIAQMAKDAYGGNIDMAVRTPQVRELIELYAQTTGQRMPLNPNVPRAVSLASMGGQLYQNPMYVNGSAYAFSSNLPTLGGGSIDTIGGGAPLPVVVQVSPQATAELWKTGTTQAIASSGRAIQQSLMSAQKASAGRRDAAVIALHPSLVTG